MTQEELASRAGLSPNAIGSLERGQRQRPHPHTVRALADAMQLPEERRASLVAAVPARDGRASRSSEPSPAFAPAGPGTPLFGREKELEELRRVLAQPDLRLLTLTGVGGVGKTRLALETSANARDHFPDGTVFIGLASLADPGLFGSTVLRSLGLGEAASLDPLEAMISHLKDKRLLLVLDNFEHLLGAASQVAALISACSELLVLVTSRAPLRIWGEREYPVPPLALPSSTRSPDTDEVLDSPSGVLFVERARAISPSFELTHENAGAVAEIYWRLAGLRLSSREGSRYRPPRV